jgi:outer membrane protein assembly factor BamA
VAPERFGDMQLEANAEYRFPLATIGGMQFNGAFFSDIGNIWFLRNNPDFENGSFQMKRLFRDLAIASGLGLRLDFGFILARLDYAYKVKDPAQPAGKTWLYDWKPFGGVLQFGINYPF